MSDPDPTAEAPDVIGTILAGRYQIESQIGEGAMGVVYKARHLKVGRPFAVKLIHSRLLVDPKIAVRFDREAELAGRLHHPNVIGVIDVGETPDGVHYMVMEFAEGRSLEAALVEAPMTPERVIALTGQILDGLYHAHQAGLIHRDLKPENVILELDDRGNELARIVDFGIAVLRERGDASPSERGDKGRLTTNGLVLGTPHYMAPEQAAGDAIDHRIDLFALGIIVYELMSGTLPFDGTGAEVARANLLHDPPPLATRVPGLAVDSLLEAFARWLLQKQPDARPATAKDARDLLDLIAHDRPAAAAALGVRDTTPRGPGPTLTTSPVRSSTETSEPPTGQSIQTVRARSGRRGMMLGIGIGIAIVVVAGAAVMKCGPGEPTPDVAAPAVTPGDAATPSTGSSTGLAVTVPTQPATPARTAVKPARPEKPQVGATLWRVPSTGSAQPAPVDATVTTPDAGPQVVAESPPDGGTTADAASPASSDGRALMAKFYGIGKRLTDLRKTEQADEELEAVWTRYRQIRIQEAILSPAEIAETDEILSEISTALDERPASAVEPESP